MNGFYQQLGDTVIMNPHILSLDVGTTTLRCSVYDRYANIEATACAKVSLLSLMYKYPLKHIAYISDVGLETRSRSQDHLETCFGWSRSRSRASKSRSRSRTSRSRVSAVNLLKTSRDHGKSNYSRITRMCILDTSY